MITEPFDADASEASDQERLTVSLNLWFTPMHRMLQPSLPLSPMLRVELARQLEFLVSDALDDDSILPRSSPPLASKKGSSHFG